jgi:hypothetical protein
VACSLEGLDSLLSKSITTLSSMMLLWRECKFIQVKSMTFHTTVRVGSFNHVPSN